VMWNFQKYMIGKEGNLIGFATPNERPYCPKILNFIKDQDDVS